ncbi:MAG: HAMP domain-containing histidine kinase [Bacteroidales bacterium]|jgi:signal transduction histidine kinase|nr:HAMP domain-containing histidine kinase [Bacteroidales bacterium]
MLFDVRHIFEFTTYSWIIIAGLFVFGYAVYLACKRFFKKITLFTLIFGVTYILCISFGAYFYEGIVEKTNMRKIAEEILNTRDTVFERKISLQPNTQADSSYQYYLTSCKKGEELVFRDNKQENCAEYFARKIKEKGIPTDVSGLYIMQGSLLHYSYLLHIKRDSVDIYMEMGKEKNIALPSEYSYALFGGDDIWFHRGDFLYSYNRKYEMLDSAAFRIRRGYVHYIVPVIQDSVEQARLQITGQNGLQQESIDHRQALVITVPVPKWYFVVYNFSFYFILFAVLFLLCELLAKRNSINKTSYAKRLRNTMVVIVASTFVVFGSIAFFFLQEWKSKEAESDLKEKMMTVLMGMESKYMSIPVAQVSDDIELQWREDMRSYSMQTVSEINIYTKKKIEGLNSVDEIPSHIYQQLYANQRHLVISDEDDYLVVYAPFRNIYNEIFGYLEMIVPMNTAAWRLEMGNFVSLYFTLILLLGLFTFLIVYLRAKYLTKPLRKISEYMAKIKLQKKNVYLEWKRDDEIGELVRQYNILIDELEKSAKQLAEAEREGAFTEMARQVAHEIKNPLTPIKLQIQQLVRAYKDGRNDFDERLHKFSNMLLDQIDVLTNIANMFSQFSLWQKPMMEKGELAPVVRTSMQLFEEKENVKWQFNDNVDVSASFDKQFLGQILGNIFRNAVQAIEDVGGEAGMVEVSVGYTANGGDADNKGQYAYIKITDNGIGIPADKLPHIFEWHFTTKSGGSGLGLSISKRLAESMNGYIIAESRETIGSTFTIHLQTPA